MAAILCQSIGSCCSGLGYCLSLPCQTCGTCCSSCCSGLGRVLTSPFTPYLLTTVVLNAPPVVWGTRQAFDVMQHNTSCQNSRWLYINAALSLIHLLAAFYIVNRIQEEDQAEQEAASAAATLEGSSAAHPIDPEATKGGATETAPSSSHYQKMNRDGTSASPAETNNKPAWQSVAAMIFPAPAKAVHVAQTAMRGGGEGHGEANSVQRLKQVFCYDVGVAVYMLAIVFWFIWQSVGISEVLFAKDVDESYICENTEKRTILSILCGFLYIMLVCVTFACSFICLK